MKHDWALVRNSFLMGLLLTGMGIFLVIFTGLNEATIICLAIGPLLLISSLAMVLFYGWMARVGKSRLPEEWNNLSAEAKRDLARKRVAEESEKGNRGAKLSLWLMRLNDTQRSHVETVIAKRDD